jgi:hypothetical protein
MRTPELHLSGAELEAFVLGKLDDPLLAGVEDHLGACPDCQQRAAAVPGDAFVDLLRSALPLTAAERDTVSECQTPDPSVPSPGATDGALPPRLPPELSRHERYRVRRLLGEGGMGSVYEAEHCVMRRVVALKVIHRAYTASPAAVERFRREVRAAARLAHPNIVTAHDAEQAGDLHFLVMEYVEGVGLARVVKEHGRLPVTEACEYVRQAALGLQHAHERGLIHRDVKPHNLIRCADSTVKVLDFGLAALAAEQGNGLTEQNAIMGTPDFMAPEQAEDPRTADARADVYSLGCTLYYLLTASVPYPAATPLLKILAHRERPVPPLRRECPEAPRGLAAVVARMLAKKPADRYQTASEVARALEPFTGRGESPRRPRRRLLTAVLAVLLLAGVALAGVVYHLQTDTAELVITTESDDVEVAVKQGGKVVRVIDTRTDRQITLTLRSGTYELELQGAPEGLKLDIDKVTLRRGDQILAKIERAPGVAADAAKTVTWSPAELPREPGPIRKLPRRSQTPCGDVSPDGRLIALPVDTNPWDIAFIRVYETATGRPLHEIHVPGEFASDFIFLPDGRHLLTSTAPTGEDRKWTFRVWDLEKGSGRVLDRVKSPGGWPHHLSASHDARRLGYSFAGSKGESFSEVVDTATGRVLWQAPADQGQGIFMSYPAVSPDGSRCVTAASWGESADGPWTKARLYAHDLDREKTLRVVDLPAGYFVEQPFVRRETGQVGALCSTPGEVPWVGFWSEKDDRQGVRLPVGSNKARGRTIVREGCHACELGPDNHLRVFTLPSGGERHQVPDLVPNELEAWFLAAGGRLLAFGKAGEIYLYRLPDPPPDVGKP